MDYLTIQPVKECVEPIKTEIIQVSEKFRKPTSITQFRTSSTSQKHTFLTNLFGIGSLAVLKARIACFFAAWESLIAATLLMDRIVFTSPSFLFIWSFGTPTRSSPAISTAIARAPMQVVAGAAGSLVMNRREILSR